MQIDSDRDRCQQLFILPRLGYEISRTPFHRFDGGVDIAID